MDKPPPVDCADDPSAAFVALPDAADAALGGNDELQRERPWWRPSLSTKRGQSAPARLLTRLTSTGDDHAQRLRHAQTMDEATTSPSGRRLGSGHRSTHVFFRALSSLTGVTRSRVVEKFRCYICFDDVPLEEAVTLSACGHRYCQSCFTSYLSSKISEGHVHPVCFHPLDGPQHDNDDLAEATRGGSTQITCGLAIADDQIQSIVDADVWVKFNKFRFTEEHEHARECPYCAFTQECVGPSDPMCVCSQCEKPFCFFHGNAHEYGTCADYELKIAEAEALNRAVINKLAKPCPGCSRDIEKNGGCNHMTCVACQTSFCWLCGEAMESVAAHYDPDGGGACSGRQHDRAQREPHGRAQRQPYDPNDYWRHERECLETVRSTMRLEVSESEHGMFVLIGLIVAFTLALMFAIIITSFLTCCVCKERVFRRFFDKAYGWLENVCVRVFGLADKAILIAFVLTVFLLLLIIHLTMLLYERMCKSSTREPTEPPA